MCVEYTIYILWSTPWFGYGGNTLSREKARGQMCCENAEYAKQKNAYTANRNMSKNFLIQILKSKVGESQCKDCCLLEEF